MYSNYDQDIIIFSLCHLEDLEWAHECFVDRHHGAGVVELAAVVGRAEQGHQLTFGEELVAVLDNLSRIESKLEKQFIH